MPNIVEWMGEHKAASVGILGAAALAGWFLFIRKSSPSTNVGTQDLTGPRGFPGPQGNPSGVTKTQVNELEAQDRNLQAQAGAERKYSKWEQSEINKLLKELAARGKAGAHVKSSGAGKAGKSTINPRTSKGTTPKTLPLHLVHGATNPSPAPGGVIVKMNPTAGNPVTGTGHSRATPRTPTVKTNKPIAVSPAGKTPTPVVRSSVKDTHTAATRKRPA